MFHTVSRLEYIFALTKAFDSNKLVRENVTHPTELADNARFFLHSDGQSGFGITIPIAGDDGYELIGVFSTVRGRGAWIVRTAVVNGACVLNCFDGHLVTFYQKHGFVEYARVANYTPNCPDVVYLEHVGA